MKQGSSETCAYLMVTFLVARHWRQGETEYCHAALPGGRYQGLETGEGQASAAAWPEGSTLPQSRQQMEVGIPCRCNHQLCCNFDADAKIDKNSNAQAFSCAMMKDHGIANECFARESAGTLTHGCKYDLSLTLSH